MTEEYTATAWARLILGSLARAGIRNLIVSPGSRSTPFLAAALATPGLTLHSVVDERSAGYFALGLGRGLGRPVAVLSTSGTAAANYFPAVIEGDLSRTPLIVLTADRPHELHHGASPQTIDQTCLFGSHVRRFVDLGMPSRLHDVLLATRRQVLAAVATATAPLPGPVHLNLRARKPLEPCDPRDGEDRILESHVKRLIGEVVAIQPPLLPRLPLQAIEDLVQTISGEPLGLIACGYDPEQPALDPAALAAFARATGYPVLIDATHPLRLQATSELAAFVVAPHPGLLSLEAWHRLQAPRLVIQLGRPLTCRSWGRWVDDLDSNHLLVLARDGWPDPTGRGRLLGTGDMSAALRLAAARFLEREAPRSSGWGARWLRANRVLGEVVQSLSTSQPRMGELEAVTTVLRTMPRGSRLVLGNSLPVREVDLLAGETQAGLSVVGLRGASGIDGVVSFAAGLGAAHEHPTVLLIGDVSFLHDIGGLWAMRDATAPLAVVVLNNRGGRIFEQLPASACFPGEQFLYFTTPHDFDLAAAGQLYGLPFARAEDPASLRSALLSAIERQGATLIEARVPEDSAKRDTLAFLHSIEDRLVRSGLLPSATSR